MNVKKSIILLLTVLLTASCSYIGEDERLIYVKPEPARRAVLLEDFTGQRCVNCPLASEMVEQLVQTYGDTALIAVGIHGGPLGFAGNARYVGLATEAGDEYFTHWGLEYQPVGLVNRHGATNYTDWAAAIKEEMGKTAPLEMNVQTSLGTEEIEIMVSEYGTDGQVDGRLQVWLLEDSVTALQLMPNGTANTDYVHNHVLRAPVNGLWGESVTVKEGEWNEQYMTFPLEESWNRQMLSIVAFVYNDEGVLQVTRAKINENENQNERPTPNPSQKEGSHDNEDENE